MNKNPHKKLNIRLHLTVFLLTASVFILGFWLSDRINQQRFNVIDEMRQDLHIDLLSADLQFSILLETAICENIDFFPIAFELYTIGERLVYMENTLGRDNPTVVRLKKYYSILQIKDWLLTKRAHKECGLDLVPILYFYGSEQECPDCFKQGHVLTSLRREHPFLRIYSFDYNLDLGVIDTLKIFYSIRGSLPILVIDGQAHSGFHDKVAVEEILPERFHEILEEKEKERERKETEERERKETEERERKEAEERERKEAEKEETSREETEKKIEIIE